ncbi:Plug domain-containing protein [Sphingobacterium sp. E70]|uniref:Plug domain-containing protein n=1 Tax=Sphingobacterium sp. E70 TaxID=2853439 RepID=UPI00211CC3CE|nr:Plug domain-containing protein [Sphingobacterium sp. E70]ULT22088.1 Plug domain-containing protein [Sphingobacterium sp. E70]
MPGASAQIVLRGFASISGDNNALIVVDGIPINNSTINENDLASNGANQSLDYSIELWISIQMISRPIQF